MLPNPKRPRLENGFLTVVTALSNITNVQPQRQTSDDENRKKYEDQKRRKNDQKAIWAQVKNFEKSVDRLNQRQDLNFHVVAHGGVEIIDKKTRMVTKLFFPKNSQDRMHLFFFIFENSKDYFDYLS